MFQAACSTRCHTQSFRRGRVDLTLLHKPDNAFSKRTQCFSEIVRDQYFAWVRSWEAQKADCALPCSRPHVRHAVFQKGQGRPYSAPQSRQCVFKTHPVKACSTRNAFQRVRNCQGPIFRMGSKLGSPESRLRVSMFQAPCSTRRISEGAG